MHLKGNSIKVKFVKKRSSPLLEGPLLGVVFDLYLNFIFVRKNHSDSNEELSAPKGKHMLTLKTTYL